MNRADKKCFWLVIYISDLAASELLKEEMIKLCHCDFDYDYERNQFIWIGFIKTLLLHARLKKYGIVSMFIKEKLTDSIWC